MAGISFPALSWSGLSHRLSPRRDTRRLLPGPLVHGYGVLPGTPRIGSCCSSSRFNPFKIRDLIVSGDGVVFLLTNATKTKRDGVLYAGEECIYRENNILYFYTLYTLKPSNHAAFRPRHRGLRLLRLILSSIHLRRQIRLLNLWGKFSGHPRHAALATS